MIEVSELLLKQFIKDPVMAAVVLMGAELDDFQRYRLRTLWAVRSTIDSSGVSTGKTAVMFYYANLRCMLLGDHRLAVYYPNWAVGQEEFWPYFNRTMERSDIFREQIAAHSGKIDGLHGSSAWQMFYKNGSILTMPAGSFLQDANTQGSRRFNTLIVDEWTQVELMGEGIGKQLVARTTRACFNQFHPVWANHLKFFGHAETPLHPGYSNRVVPYQRNIRDGSRNHALISFNYLDWSPKFARKYLERAVIAEEKSTLTEDHFRRKWLGIWSRDGATYYPQSILLRACRLEIVPVFRREYDREVNTCGVDVAPGQSINADSCAVANCRIIEIGERSTLQPTHYHPLTRVPFHISFPFAHMMRDVSSGQVSGFIHLLHRIYSYSGIMLDPGGGGLWIYKDLKNPLQMINNVQTQVVPLCTAEEPLQMDKQAVVVFFKRGPQLNPLFQQQFMVSDDGFLDACHRRFREAWEAPQFVWPQRLEHRAPAQVRGFSHQELWAHRYLDLAMDQLSRVRQAVKADGTPDLTSRGFARFESPKKKDLAYAVFYSFIAAVRWMHEHSMGMDSDGEVACEFGAQ